MKCPVCSSKNIDAFLEINDMPVIITVLKSFEEAVNCPKGDINLSLCSNCGNIFNKDFDPELVNYTEEYDNALDFSPRFREYNKELAKRLINSYNIKNKSIIDIGCGKGHFLNLLCRLGNNRGIGFDASCTDQQVKESTDNIRFIKDYYSEKHKDKAADLISCKYVLEHVDNPFDFIANIRN
ncbi:class I SAM-dependent methyltransferase, partial [Candidatus Woesearchaeota archaeon]|nr:class I SAM-dependent methyltransferase [Candidatus Woesearchaeota archaeon]